MKCIQFPSQGGMIRRVSNAQAFYYVDLKGFAVYTSKSAWKAAGRPQEKV